MATGLMPDVGRATNIWEVLDQELHKKGIHCGWPMGATREHITTLYKPLAEMLAMMNPKTSAEQKLEEVTPEDEEWQFHRHWLSSRQWKRSFQGVVVFKSTVTGKCRVRRMSFDPNMERYNMMVDTGVKRARYSSAEAELTARQRLFKALTSIQQDCYINGDGFVETGRSGIKYLLRRNRPTLANRVDADGEETLLCALCLHPVAYYTESWAGVLPPSDEVLAHLLMIRSDEHFYWRKANQIPIGFPTSGV